MKVGYLSHAFDLLNVEHLDMLRQAKAHCDRLLVGVLSDADAQEATGVSPVVPFAERLALIEHVRLVDQAVLHEWHRRNLIYDVVFVFDGELTSQPPLGVEVRVLAQPRRSGSSILVRALHPQVGEAVA